MCKPNIPTNHLTSDLGIELTSCATLDKETRRALLKQLKNGDLDELDFDAIVFRAIYPNSNYLRFKDEDLPALAASFSGQPFLRNHDVHDIGARDGTIQDSTISGDALKQRIHLTTERGIRDFLQGRIDRFSIGWYFDDIECSICGQRWMECNHWPGNHYPGPRKGDPEQLCELVFINPKGKETSAVNAPAVQGTKILSNHTTDDLAAILEAKRQLQGEKPNQDNSPEPETNPDPSLDSTIPPESQVKESLMHGNSPTANTEPTVVDATPEPAQPATAAKPTQLAQETQTAPEPKAAAPAPRPEAAAMTSQPKTETAIVTQQPTVQPDTWLAALRNATTTAMLTASGLPAAAQDVVRLAIGDNVTDPAQIQRLIDAQRTAYALEMERSLVRNIHPVHDGRVTNMMTSLDKYKSALFAMLDNRRPENNERPMSGIKEAYVLATGDWAMTGRFDPDAAQLANITSASLPDMMAEWLNQRVVLTWQSYDQWYRQFCQIENFTSLRDPHWIKIGGIGELSEVGEGAAYEERDWVAQSETTAWTKKGNWIGLTIEAIDRDTTGYIQQLPRALVQGAWLTISKDFTRRLMNANGAGYGYTMQSDSKALFHADHNNLGNSALSWSSWDATRLAMARQTDLGTGEVLGGLTLPATLMIPRHLENTALTMLATERVLGSGNNDVNPLAVGGNSIEARVAAAKKMLVVNDFLGTANGWFAFADLQRFPLFGLGFRWGETPEIFSVADPKSGLMFTNDVMPIKIRWYYSLGAIDYRGMYYHRAA